MSTTRSPKATSRSPSTTCTRRENRLNAQEAQLQGEQSQAQTAGQRGAERGGAERPGHPSAEERAGPGTGSDRRARPATARRPRQPPPSRPAQARQAAAGAPQQPGRPLRIRLQSRRTAPARRRSPKPRRPTAPGGAGACRRPRARSGAPYVWGGESPKRSASPGFDCSGPDRLVLGPGRGRTPHYSGAQMADSTPVPISDLQPGDLLFYGPGGSEHVAMYVGPGDDDRGALHRSLGLGHLPPPGRRLRRAGRP